jgi:AhpD family alkylhydroperoxidase
MKTRIEYSKATPGVVQAMSALERYVAESGLEPSLVDLVKLRASLINGCAYCIDMHTKDARARGESEQRLYALSAWCETPFYSERERAALVSESHVPDAVYEEARQQFGEKELADLTLAVIAINGWNRLAISFRTEPGTYQPRRHE